MKSVEEIERLIAETEASMLEKMEKKKSYILDNRVEYFTKFEGEVDPDKTLAIPKQNYKQQELFDAIMSQQFRAYVYSGANRTGKTTTWAALVPCICAGEWLWTKEKISFKSPKSRRARKIRIVGQDWEKHIKTVVIPALREWWPKNRPVEVKKNNVGIEAFWKDVKTGSTVEIMSNRQESDLFEGWDGDIIIYDEPPKRDVRIACARGLIDRGGCELFCMTLLKEAWVHQEVINKLDELGRPDKSVFSINAEMVDNVGFGITQKDMDHFASLLTDDEKDARIFGIPSYMSGLVLPQFKRRKHLVDRFQVPADWIVDIAIDVHPREKQAVLFNATSPRNDRYCCHEIWNNGDGDWLGAEIVRVINNNAYRVGSIIIDPLAKADQNNENTVFGKVERILSQYGYLLEVASKSKDDGILLIKEGLEGPNKEPSQFFFNDLVRTIFEIEGWMWDEDTQKAAKKNDHMMENLYRLSLLNTVWYPLDDYFPYEESVSDNRNAMTGY